MEQVLDWRYNTIIDGVVVTKKVSLSFHRLQVRKVKMGFPIADRPRQSRFTRVLKGPVLILGEYGPLFPKNSMDVIHIHTVLEGFEYPC